MEYTHNIYFRWCNNMPRKVGLSYKDWERKRQAKKKARNEFLLRHIIVMSVLGLCVCVMDFSALDTACT